MALSLPGAVRARVEAAVGGTVGAVTPVSGGCISRAARVETDAGTLFVKWHAAPPPGFFGVEALGLARLAATQTVRVPRVLSASDAPGVACVIMDWIEPTRRPREPALADAGRRLALLHATGGLQPGFEIDGWIGTLPQPNAPVAGGSWLAFFRERRLQPLASALPAASRRRLDALRLDTLLDEPAGGCALLHGDLWAGNLVCGESHGYLVDPAVYAGHPEVDLAMTRLFGGFGDPFEAAYREISGPWRPGFDERAALLNLYPLLVHVRLFGGAYVAQVDATLRRFT